ncbi:hypothetical protein D3C80_2201290 [compost metagenome]
MNTVVKDSACGVIEALKIAAPADRVTYTYTVPREAPITAANEVVAAGKVN